MPYLRPTRTPQAVLAAMVLVASTLVSSSSIVAAQEIPDRCEIVGTPGPDVLVGTDADEVMCGLGGNDILRGGGGNDELIGGPGDDELIGGPGDDELRGGEGNDEVYGGPGADLVRGGADDDTVVGGPGNDILRGGDGADTMAGGDGADVLRGGNGNDILRGSAGSDTAFGGAGDDILRGSTGNDRLLGGPDKDICEDPTLTTDATTCEFGRGGDDRAVAVGRQLWRLNGSTEFVYGLAITTPCPDTDSCGVPTFADVVHVVGERAEGPFGTPAFSASALFGLAEAAESDGRKVVFDSVLGLPERIDNVDGGTISVGSVQLRDDLRAAYEQAVGAWTANAIADYSYTTETQCYCPFVAPLRVTVDNSDAVSSESIGGGTPSFSAGALTIDAHLANFGELLDGRAINLVGEFDERGVPTYVSVDGSFLIADDERSIQIRDFVDNSAAGSNATDGDAMTPTEPDEPNEPEVLGPELVIVSVRSISVAESIADDVEALLAAADADGFNLSGGGFRDPQRQIELRKQNCGSSDFAIYEMPASECSPPTARPGQSQHELGLAIDFTNNGRLVTTRDDAAFVWLAANAGRFGFINLPSEPWHWSTTGK